MNWRKTKKVTIKAHQDNTANIISIHHPEEEDKESSASGIAKTDFDTLQIKKEQKVSPSMIPTVARTPALSMTLAATVLP